MPNGGCKEGIRIVLFDATRVGGSKMKKIVLFSRDPGGANTIIPLVSKLKSKYEVLLFGKDVALIKYEQNQLEYRNIIKECKEISIKSMEQFLEKYSPDFVITGTSADDHTEKYLWKAATRLGIPSFAILDQWVNYGIRFSKYGVSQIREYEESKLHEYMPTKILVMDELAKQEMIREGIEEEKVLVTGQPYFDCFIEQMDEIGEQTILASKELLGVREEPIIVFVSEPICKTYGENKNYWGYKEETIFRIFHNTLNRITKDFKKRITVIIRPHPKEEIDIWNQRVKETPYISYRIDTKVDGKVVIKMADLICGMSSMFLLEAALYQKKIMSIQIGLSKENPFLLDQNGIIKSILEEKDLQEKLACFFRGEWEDYHWDIQRGASDKVVEWMEEFI